MITLSDLLTILRLSIQNPEEAGRQLIALNPPMPLRWMLLGAAVMASVVLLYLLPVAMGEHDALPSPFAFAATQGGMNLVVVALVTFVGSAFGGKGRFADVLWLVGWMQVVTAALLIVQLVVMLLLPILNIPVGAAAVAISIWVLVGFICAVHGFKSRVAVLVAGFMTFMVFSFILSLILLFLGFGPAEIANV